MASSRCLHVVVAGGGAAATEAVFVLREHGGAQVSVTIVAPEPVAEPRALPVAASFTAGHRAHRPLPELARDLGAGLVGGRVVAVDDRRHRVHLDGGRALAYDALVLAVGAAPRHTIDRALTLFGEAGRVAVDRVLAEQAPIIDFVVPSGVTRTLSLYELAVHVAEDARAREHDVALRVISPERVPAEAFGARAQSAVAELLDDCGVAFEGASSVFEGLDGLLRVNDAATILPGARTVALPVLDGPSLPGVPATAEGFVPVDEHGAVVGMTNVFAAGDATACPLKHVDVACAQAAAVADVLAQRAGVAVTPAPWSPAIREHLLVDHGVGDLTLATGRAADAVATLRAR
ncbi:FAD-dependent oxidoreductase [Baekduia alba]|uniref:FAD-dependent oxidoreductase n=1 Tax=Baekduia alba TaxID=2997333 RepID=UPI002340C1DE|nr:FAD-dependent oxidoreductase [Baekduia alba]